MGRFLGTLVILLEVEHEGFNFVSLVVLSPLRPRSDRRLEPNDFVQGLRVDYPVGPQKVAPVHEAVIR